MGKTITIQENGVHLNIEITGTGEVRLLHFSSLDLDEDKIGDEKGREMFHIVELKVSGEEQYGLSSKHIGPKLAKILNYAEHKDYRNKLGRKLEIWMETAGLFVVSHFQFFDSVSIIRAWTELKNMSREAKGVESVSSFFLNGIAKEGFQQWSEKSRLHIPHNGMCGEAQWKSYGLPEIGLSKVHAHSSKRLAFSGTGTCSTSEYLPMGCFENVECGTCLFWQIENNGPWYWEISDIRDHLYLYLSGPTENESHWWKKLNPGESFTSVPAAVGVANGSFEQAIRELTRYRRIIRRANRDNEKLPVIFNDFMYCLFSDVTAEKTFPLVDTAAGLGCEYYVIDAGWYSEGWWWDGVGEWIPSEKRFPRGIKEVTDYIRAKGMIPGLWIEIEVMGVNCPLAEKVPATWFFQKHGRKIIQQGRYQLDFRNPEVVRHADEVIDRIVRGYGVGYIKIDYNIGRKYFSARRVRLDFEPRSLSRRG
ncbi:MAG: alpha-galactosidase [Spirochaetota bacterium]